MAAENPKTKKYVCAAGETWDGLALRFYGSELLFNHILDSNKDKIDIVIFEGGEEIDIPLIDLESIEMKDSLPPWRR